MPVISVTETQQIDLAGTLTDLYEIVFTISGHPGSFTFTVPKSGNVVSDAAAIKAGMENVINELYAL
jgi:hypothetical protein